MDIIYFITTLMWIVAVICTIWSVSTAIVGFRYNFTDAGHIEKIGDKQIGLIAEFHWIRRMIPAIIAWIWIFVYYN